MPQRCWHCLLSAPNDYKRDCLQANITFFFWLRSVGSWSIELSNSERRGISRSFVYGRMKLIEELCIFKKCFKIGFWLNLFFFYPNLLRALSPVVGAIKEKWLYVPLSGSRVVFGRQKEPNEAFIGFILMKSILVLFLSHPHHNFWDRRPLEESQTHFQNNLNCEFFLS